MRANCCICSDVFDEINSISATSCGHVYHTNCLMVWIGTRKTCPVCRASLKSEKVLKLFFNFNNTDGANYSCLENNVSDLNAQLLAKDAELRECKKQRDDIRTFVKAAEKKAADLQQTVYKYENEATDLRLRIKEIPKLESELKKLKQNNIELNNDVQLMKNVQSIVQGTRQDVERILQESGNSFGSTKQMATYCSVLKRELEKVLDSKNKLLELNSKLKLDNSRYSAKIRAYENDIRLLTDSRSPGCSKYMRPLPVTSFQSDSKAVLQELSPEPCKTLNSNVDISPLSTPFSGLKFNLHIGPVSAKPVKQDKVVENRKAFDKPYVEAQSDDDSIIRTGYNGLGGHSNFINVSGTRGLKRKL